MAFQHELAASLSSAPIGVFDSGVGGLTVLRELNRQLPNESILYLGDTARLPYGDRTPEEILQFVRDIIAWMMEQGVKMVMMACNTSSALALEQVQQEFPVPILGLIYPGARAAAKAGKRIGVIATPATVASNAYHQAILEVDATVRVWQVGCPQFVPLIEQNRLQDPVTLDVAKTYLQPLLAAQIDTLIYGCTHYPHLEPVFQKFLPVSIRRVDPARSLVKAAAKELELLNLKSNLIGQPTRFFVSGCPDQFSQLAKRWLGHAPNVGQVSFASAVTQSEVI
ncbi:glutamate racemase [Oscillatoria sp. CS-180]|uniref:glutamate racemase n=1 Tax=Oscillatoria sp. CS-180 TaxID=3021720 RepID=UPI00232E8C21|nr:glutamate racemase [Oscillatoria sp. CS-180]MDB9526014.1 glutamate racemase [Oscillatoria sp. CS-180]